MKFNRLSLACILGALILSRGFWADLISPLGRGLLPSSEKPDQKNQTGEAEQSLANCHVATVRPAILTIFAGEEIGTGSIVSRDGLVLTNEHVVREVGYGEIRARRWGGSLYKGKVVATNATHDLALIKLNLKESSLPTIAFAKPEAIKNGQAVCALGSPRAITGVLARGTLIGDRGTSDLQSAIFLQPGNSGGPLLNEQGEMIGVNKSIWLSETGENVKRSFATNVTVASHFFEENKSKASPFTESPIAEHVPPSTMPTKPLDFSPPRQTDLPLQADAPLVAPGTHLGAIVNSQTLVIQLVEPESPAEKAGLNAGDRLLKVNDRTLYRLKDLDAFLDTKPARATFTVSRDNNLQAVTVVF